MNLAARRALLTAALGFRAIRWHDDVPPVANALATGLGARVNTPTHAVAAALLAIALAAQPVSASCARQLAEQDIVRIAEEHAKAFGCFEPGIRARTDAVNTDGSMARGYDPVPAPLARQLAGRAYRAVYLAPPDTDPPTRLDGDLFVFIDGCDGRILGEMRWCGR